MWILYVLSLPCSTYFQGKCASVEKKKKNPTFDREKRSAEIYSQSLRQYFKLSKKGEEMLSNPWTLRGLSERPTAPGELFFCSPKAVRQSQILNTEKSYGIFMLTVNWGKIALFLLILATIP